MDPLAPARIKVRGTRGCELLKHVESVDPRVAEGLKREQAVPIQQRGSASKGASKTGAAPPVSEQAAREDLEKLVEEEKRRAITDPFQLFLYDARAMHKKGNFKSPQGEVILSRIRNILDKSASALDCAGFMLFDDFCTELLAPYLRAKSCKLASVNLSGTQIGVNGAIAIARAANPLLQSLQLSGESPIPVLLLRREAQCSRAVALSRRKFSHLDAAALGVLVERECKIERIDLSENQLTGPRANVFHGILTLFHGLKRCLKLRELNLDCVCLRSEGLVALADAITDFHSLERLVLSRNQLVCNGFGEKNTTGVEALCEVLSQTKKLTSLVLSDNELDYLSCIPFAKMLAENHMLTAVDLSRNPVGDAGAVHVAAGIKKNASLLSFNLSACQLGSDAFAELADSLRKFNRKLHSIDLRENADVRSRGYRELAKCLSINPTLSRVELSTPPATRKYLKFAERLREYVQVNTALQSLRRGFQTFDFAALDSDVQRTNFVEKLRDLSESELQALCEMHVMESARVAVDPEASVAAMEQSGGSFSNLRVYASLSKNVPLKRLLWVLETAERQAHLKVRAERLKIPTRSKTVDEFAFAHKTMAPPPALKAGPITRVCHVCGRQYGLSSFEIHLKQCKKLWITQEELKPKGERRPLPKTPPSLGQMSESEIALSGGGGKVDREAIEAMNRAAQESYNVHGMEKCENCGRTFAEGRLAIHSKSCRPDNVAKKVGDGAAPRGKGGDAEVENSRLRSSVNGASSETPAPAKKSQPRPPTDPSATSSSASHADSAGASRTGSSSSSRALSGSIASNRKSPPSGGSRQATSQFQTPLSAGVAEIVTPDGLRDELKGKESMIDAIQSKLEQWEATTLATLQEIRDLKQIFGDLKQ